MVGVEQLMAAIKRGDVSRVKSLLKEDPALLGAKADDGVPAPLLSIYHGHPEIAEIFVERGVELDFVTACAAGKIERVAELIKDNPGLAIEFSPDGYTPLGLAAFFGHAQVVELLLENGAAVSGSSRNAMRVAPLHSAVARRDVESVRLLLRKGADVNARQQGGFTPLHGVAAAGHEDLVAVLLEWGAEADARAENGKTPIDLARERGNDKVVEMLTRARALSARSRG